MEYHAFFICLAAKDGHEFLSWVNKFVFMEYFAARYLIKNMYNILTPWPYLLSSTTGGTSNDRYSAGNEWNCWIFSSEVKEYRRWSSGSTRSSFYKTTSTLFNLTNANLWKKETQDISVYKKKTLQNNFFLVKRVNARKNKGKINVLYYKSIYLMQLHPTSFFVYF